MRLLCAAAISLSLGLLVVFAEDKKPAEDNKPAETKKVETAKERADKLTSLQKKFDSEMDDLKKRFKEATTNGDRNGIRAEARELGTITAQKAMTIAESDPKDATGFDAAAFIIDKTAQIGVEKEVEKAVGMIVEHHLNNPKVKAMLLKLAASPAGHKLVKAAADRATDNEVKGIALFFLGAETAERLNSVEDEKTAGEVIAKAKGYFEEAAKLAPEAKINEITIAMEVADQLNELKQFQLIAIGKPAPDLESEGLDGKKVKLSDYKGKVVLLDMWATWCGPCRSMIPHERKMVKSLQEKPFVLVSVSADDEKETLEKFLEKEPMPWVHWWNGAKGKILKKLRIDAFPTLFLIDHTGVIRNKWIGVPDDDKLEKAIEDAVADAVKAKG